MATYTFSPVPAWGAVGEFARVGIQRNSTFPATLPGGGNATVVQGGVTKVGYVESDDTGMIPAFTTTDIPSVVVDFGLGTLTINSVEAITAGATSAAAAASSASAAASSASTANTAKTDAQAARDAAIGASIGVTLQATGTAATDLSNLNTQLSSCASLGVPLNLRGAFQVNGTITGPSNVTVNAHSSSITQTTSNTTTITLASGSTWNGGTITGKGTDYVAGTGTPVALGISVTGDNVTVRNAMITNHAGAGIRLNNANNFRCSGTRIIGVSPGQTIPAVDSACFGVYILTATNSTFDTVEISDCSIGMITSVGCTHLSLRGMKFHDIPGQHGAYIQNATGLNIDGVDCWNINLNAVKLQLNNTVTSDSTSTAIANITAVNCGDTALTINNIDTALTYKYRSLSVTNVSSTGCGRGLYLGSVRGGAISNVTVYNCVNDAFTLIDCQNIEGANWVADTVGRIGVRFTSATGTVQDHIRIRGLRLHNCANNNEANNLYGIYMLQGSNVTLDGPIVTATNGFMQYGLFLSSAVAGDQNTFALRDAEFSGDTGTSARFQGTVTGVKDWGNNRFSGSILNKPNSVTATIAVP